MEGEWCMVSETFAASGSLSQGRPECSLLDSLTDLPLTLRGHSSSDLRWSNSWYGASREFPEEHLLVFRVSEMLCLVRKRKINEDISGLIQQKATVQVVTTPSL